MSLRYFIHILFKRKWYILTALFAAPLVAGIILLFVEPVYVSHCKLEIHDRSNANDPLGSARSTVKDDVFIQKQIESIATDRVMNLVIDKAGLFPTPPSQSIWARWTGIQTPSKYPPDVERIELVRALKNPAHVRPEAINPVVLNITVQMNTPMLAKKTCEAVFQSYCEEFVRLQKQDSQLEVFFANRLKAIDALIAECDKEMEDFSKLHRHIPTEGSERIVVPIPDQANNLKPLPNAPAGQEKPVEKEAFNPRAGEISPVQMLMSKIAELEIKLIEVEQHNSKTSFAYRDIADQIQANKKLLEGYLQNLSEQQQLAVKWSGLTWRRETLRQSYQKTNEELTKIKTTSLALSDPMSTIKVQDDPTYDPQPIFPKKTIILAAAAFIGLVLGLAMAYIAHVLDTTYHLPEDFTADTGIPVLASIPWTRR